MTVYGINLFILRLTPSPTSISLINGINPNNSVSSITKSTCFWRFLFILFDYSKMDLLYKLLKLN